MVENTKATHRAWVMNRVAIGCMWALGAFAMHLFGSAALYALNHLFDGVAK